MQDDKLIIAKLHAPMHYSLEELIARCDFYQPFYQGDQEWLDASAMGDEEI